MTGTLDHRGVATGRGAALDEGFTAANAAGIALILAGAWLAARPASAGYGL